MTDERQANHDMYYMMVELSKFSNVDTENNALRSHSRHLTELSYGVYVYSPFDVASVDFRRALTKEMKQCLVKYRSRYTVEQDTVTETKEVLYLKEIEKGVLHTQELESNEEEEELKRPN